MSASTRTPALADRWALARNTVYNLTGQVAPLVAAVFAMPGLLHALGTERLGVLALAWALVGYFSVFDFGIGRALTKLVAERIGTDREIETGALVSSATVLLAAVSAIVALTLIVLSAPIVSNILRVRADLQAETVSTLYVLAAGIPFVVTSGALRGVLEAQHRFGVVNAIRIPLGVLTFVGPWLMAQYVVSLPAAVLVLTCARIGAWAAHAYFCLPLLRNATSFSVNSTCVRMLLNLGGWMTVSNVVGPLMVYLDRFVLGALVSMAAVAYYATPYEVITKLWLVPAAISGVLFPLFAVHARPHSHEGSRLLALGLKWVFLLVFPWTLIAVTFAHEGLAAWLGAEFAEHSATVLRILALGVLANCLAQIPFAFIQAAGRPDLTAKLHLLELPLYLLALWGLVQHFGIAGAALAWLARVMVDLGGLLLISGRWLAGSTTLIKRVSVVAISTIAGLMVPFTLVSVTARSVFLCGALALFVAAAARYALREGERKLLRNPLSVFTRQ
jgi:O-antigen/teichoic acid export membrane protein